jgi:undecaprenol kinase
MDVPKLIISFGYAFYGIWTAMKEQNMRIHFFCALIVIIAGLLTGITTTEWVILIMIIALVIGAEMINTAIESAVNLSSPEIHPLAKVAKDVAAGAVLVFAIASVIIGLLIFLPRWI